jgi:hypothetical protein
VELQRNAARYREQGLGVAAISYDSAAVLADFARRKGIELPLLSDEGSRIIRAFGILNDTVPQGTPFYGIPYPGTFIVDAAGTVTAKFFEDDFRERYTAGDILVRHFGAEAGAARTEIETRHLRLRLAASSAGARWGQRIALVMEVEPKPGTHVYAPGVAGGYIPVEWRMDESEAWKAHAVESPPGRSLHLAAIDETVPVYVERFRMMRDVTIGPDAKVKPLMDGEGNLLVTGTFRYQACDEKVCYTPQTVPVSWKLHIEAPDTARAPEPLRRP